MGKREWGEVDDPARLRLDPDRQDRDLRVTGLQRAVAAAAQVAAPGKVGELHPEGRRDEHLACVRIRERGPGALEGVGLVEDGEIPVRAPAVSRRREVELLAAAPGDGLLSLAVEHDLGGRRAVQTARQLRGFRFATWQPVHHPGPVRSGHHDALDTRKGRVEGDRPVDAGLPVVGAEHHRVALEKLVRPPGRLDERADRGVAARQRFLGLLRAERVRGEVVVGQVVDEEVEAVTRD